MAAALALGAAVLTSAGIVPLARFEAERIDLLLHARHVEVEGTYVYRNPFPILASVMRWVSVDAPK